VPVLAARAHSRNLPYVMEAALEKAGCGWNEVDVLAVTSGPGLAPCLRVGVKAAVELAAEHGVPLMPVNHLEGHALVARMEERSPFPFLATVVSGGHSLLVHVNGVGEYAQLGTTQDDALGEAFDKVARMLELGSDGDKAAGQILEELAATGDPNAYDLTIPMLNNVGLPNFSFSGLKSAIHRIVSQNTLSHSDKANVAASFQRVAVEHVTNSIRRALVLSGCQLGSGPHITTRMKRQVSKDIARKPLAKAPALARPQALVVSGGVASNKYLRSQVETVASVFDIPVQFPAPALCTDNGLMIAWAGLENYLAGERGEELEKKHAIDAEDVAWEIANPRWRLEVSRRPSVLETIRKAKESLPL